MHIKNENIVIISILILVLWTLIATALVIKETIDRPTSSIPKTTLAPSPAYTMVESEIHTVESPKTISMRVTAYCPCEKCCGKWADGITANGHKIGTNDRFVAAPRNIPFNTMLNVPGYGIVPTLDRGGAIKGNKLDVFFDTHQEALEWGVQYLEVSYANGNP